MSRISSIAVSAYVRTAAAVAGDNDMGNDLLMGRVDLTPVLEGHVRILLTDILSVLHTNGVISMPRTNGTQLPMERDPFISRSTSSNCVTSH